MNLFVAVDKMQSWKKSNVLRLTWARWKSFNISPEIRFCTYNQMFWKVAYIPCLLATQTQHPSRECSQLLRKIRNWTRNYLADANFIKFFGFLLNSSNINQSYWKNWEIRKNSWNEAPVAGTKRRKTHFKWLETLVECIMR